MQTKTFPRWAAKPFAVTIIFTCLIALSSASVIAQSDEDGSVTHVEVATVIEVTGPGLLSFGSGVPGDTLGLEDLVRVRTNHPAGYDLSWLASDMVNTGNGVIAAENLAITLDGSSSVATTGRTDDAGFNHALAAILQLPFVESGTYNGTVVFTATTH